MPELTQSEKKFLCAGLILQILDSPIEFGLAWHATAAEIAKKLCCTAELRAAAGNYMSWKKTLENARFEVCK